MSQPVRVKRAAAVAASNAWRDKSTQFMQDDFLKEQTAALSELRQVVHVDGFEIEMLLSHDIMDKNVVDLTPDEEPTSQRKQRRVDASSSVVDEEAVVQVEAKAPLRKLAHHQVHQVEDAPLKIDKVKAGPVVDKRIPSAKLQQVPSLLAMAKNPNVNPASSLDGTRMKKGAPRGYMAAWTMWNKACVSEAFRVAGRKVMESCAAAPISLPPEVAQVPQAAGQIEKLSAPMPMQQLVQLQQLLEGQHKKQTLRLFALRNQILSLRQLIQNAKMQQEYPQQQFLDPRDGNFDEELVQSDDEEGFAASKFTELLQRVQQSQSRASLAQFQRNQRLQAAQQQARWIRHKQARDALLQEVRPQSFEAFPKIKAPSSNAPHPPPPPDSKSNNNHN